MHSSGVFVYKRNILKESGIFIGKPMFRDLKIVYKNINGNRNKRIIKRIIFA
jgi:hypothetical protein